MFFNVACFSEQPTYYWESGFDLSGGVMLLDVEDAVASPDDVVKEDIMTQYLNTNRYPFISASAIKVGSSTDTLLFATKHLLAKLDKEQSKL